MARRARVPHELRTGPFTLEQARAAGTTSSALKGRAWRRLGTELYCWAGARDDHQLLLSAWRRLLPPDAAFAGATAAWIHGLDLDPVNPVEIVVPPRSSIRARVDVNIHRSSIRPDEVAIVRGLPTATLHRALTDLCVRWRAEEALVALDMAVSAGLTDTDALFRHAEAESGRPGIQRLRTLAELAAPAESPMETRLRWLLIRAGLRPSGVQTNLHDAAGGFVGRADLYYPEARLIVEFDGGNHRDRLVEDNRRQNALVNSGYQILRFTTADLHQRPQVIVAQVRGALAAPTEFARLIPNGRNMRHQARVWRQTGGMGGAGNMFAK